VVARPGARIDEDALREHCRAQIAAYKCPKRFVIVDALPRNSMGKIEKFRVRADVVAAVTADMRQSG
jgi:long-chain acyl-CoA synthetase